MLPVLAPACERIICTTAPTPRAMPAAELADAARTFVSTVEVVPDFTEALARSITHRNPVVAAGSIFLIGPLRDILR
jgi:folylpolyglutamate synthase/dihydropteroate synthase